MAETPALDGDSNNAVHYVLGEQQFVLGQDENSGPVELDDIICPDGSRAILVDGQYLLTDSQGILLQGGNGEEETQYYIDNSQGFVVNAEDLSSGDLFEGTEVVHLIENGGSNDQQIIYYTSEETVTDDFNTMRDIEAQEAENLNIGSIQDEDGNIYPFKRIKLEGRVLDLEEFDGALNIHQATEEGATGVQYAVVEDDSYQMCSYDSDSNQIINASSSYNDEIVEEDDEKQDSRERLMKLKINTNQKDTEFVDLSKITGRNLITGQTVTLHSYMEKLKKKFNTDNIASLCTSSKQNSKKIYSGDLQKPVLESLLDKKISIGHTKCGKKIVGKIIDVKRSADKDECKEKAPVVFPDCKNPVSSDNIDEISKTLSGIMDMESVKKKLENRNVIVKLVEKRHLGNGDGVKKTTSYGYGYMEKESGDAGEEKWKFVPETEAHGEIEDGEARTTKYSITTSLTIVISYNSSGYKTIRVNLNPAPGNLCTVCAKYFKSGPQLRLHMDSVHNRAASFSPYTPCEVCNATFEDRADLQQHKQQHIDEGKLFACSECGKCFTTQNRLQKHLPIHDLYLRPLECSVCEIRCGSQWALKKHLLTHTGIKPFGCDVCQKQFLSQYDLNFHKKIHFPEKHFACNVCMRTFSRHSNLLRHMEIHKGTGALYKCPVCYCSYNFISSLTRHMVQNHIDHKEKVEKF